MLKVTNWMPRVNALTRSCCILGAAVLGTLTTGFYTMANGTDLTRKTPPALSDSTDFHALRVQIPDDMTTSDLERPTSETRSRLYKALRSKLKTSDGRHGDLVVFVDHENHPIIFNGKGAGEPGHKHSHNQAGGPSNSALNFTFDSPDEPWSPDELTSVTGWVHACYQQILDLYGPPAFANTVNVRKVAPGLMTAAYSSSTNEIFLGTIDGAPVCHEIIHAFHDDFMLGLSTWEEGMARAVEVEACTRAGIRDDVGHDYYYDIHYEQLNQPAIGAIAGNLFAGWGQTLLRYQLAGYAWAKPMLEDRQFFVRFNQALYALAVADPSVTTNETILSVTAAQAKSSVEDVPFSDWYSSQQVFNTNPPVGDLLYIRASGIYNLYIFLLHRDPSGAESDIAGAQVLWTATDHMGNVLGTATGTTTAYGWVPIDNLEVTNYWVNHHYHGRLKFTASAVVNGVFLEGTAYSKASPGDGVFGVVVGADTGSILFTPLDSDTPPLSVIVKDGSFQALDLLSIRGRIQYMFTNSEGRESEPVVFTKDATPYFLQIDASLTKVCGRQHRCSARRHPDSSFHRSRQGCRLDPGAFALMMPQSRWWTNQAGERNPVLSI